MYMLSFDSNSIRSKFDPKLISTVVTIYKETSKQTLNSVDDKCYNSKVHSKGTAKQNKIRLYICEGENSMNHILHALRYGKLDIQRMRLPARSLVVFYYYYSLF